MKHLSLAATAAALLCTSALAQDSGVLTGADAFGGWKDDKPGVQRHITIEDLQPAKPEESASNSAQPVPMTKGAMPLVPDGYKIEMIASGLENPRVIRFAPNGDLFVALSDLGQVKVLRFVEGQDKPEIHTFIEVLTQHY